MKTILAYGDSLTWGCLPGMTGRHAFEDRWPTSLDGATGGKFRILAEGLNGRTTVFDDFSVAADRNGARVLPTILATHAPLDLVILMLGTNDLKPFLSGSAYAAAGGMGRLVQLVRHYGMTEKAETPAILIVSPPHIAATDNPAMRGMDALIEESHQLGPLYRAVAEQNGCAFFDAASAVHVSAVDGVHMDAANSRILGEALAPIVTKLLTP